MSYQSRDRLLGASDLYVSPAAAAYESGKPFWEKMGDLR